MKKTPPLSEPALPPKLRIPFVTLFRVFVLGSVAVIAAAWSIFHYYTTKPVPMLVPRASSAPAPSPTEIPIEMEP